MQGVGMHVWVLNRIPERFNRIPADIKKNHQKAKSTSVKCFMYKEGRAEQRGSLMPREKKEQAKSFI